MMHFFFVKLFIDDFKLNPEKIKDITKEQLQEKLNGIEKLDFSKSGKFGNTGGAGGLNDIKKKLIQGIRYFKTTNYDRFIEDYKKNHMQTFKGWLTKNVKH